MTCVRNMILLLSTEKNPLIALCLLPYLLPDCRSKPDSEKIVQFSHVREQSSLGTIQCTMSFFSTCIGCGHRNCNSDLSSRANGGGCG